jgi:hypothetical protein
MVLALLDQFTFAMTMMDDAIQPPFINFRDHIRALPRFPDKLQQCLVYGSQNDDAANAIGLKLLSCREFAANIKIFAQYINRKRNTVALAFRTHQVRKLRLLRLSERARLADTHNCKVYSINDDIIIYLFISPLNELPSNQELDDQETILLRDS